MPDPSGLNVDDLKAALLTHGVKAGPIVGEAAFNSALKLVFNKEMGFLFCIIECSPAVFPSLENIVYVSLHQGFV